MNYILSDNFLYTSDSMTSIKFIKSDKIQCYEDLNSRSLTVYFSENTKYSDLAQYIDGFKLYSNSLVEENEFLMRMNSKTVINGVRYYVNNSIYFMSCLIVTPREDLKNGSEDYRGPDGQRLNVKIVNSNSLQMILDESKIVDLESYLNFINEGFQVYYKGKGKSKNKTPSYYEFNSLIYAEVEDESKFGVSNFRAVDLTIPTELNIIDDEPYVDNEFSINESMIVSAFVDTLRNKFPEYTFAPELTEEVSRVQKRYIGIYEAKLAEMDTQWSTHVRYRPDLGRYNCQTIEMTLELLTDDIQTYIYTRDALMVGKHLFQVTTFEMLDPYGRTFTCTSDWSNSDLSSEIDRGPKSRYFDETILYTISLNIVLVGWIVEKMNMNIKPIYTPCIQIYTGHNIPNNSVNLESEVVDGKMVSEISSGGLPLDKENTNLFYEISGISHMASINRETGEFSFINMRGPKYTGKVNFTTGDVTFYERIHPYTKEVLGMETGTIVLSAVYADNWLSAFRIIAEIADYNRYEEVSKRYRFMEEVEGEEGKYILSINKDLIDEIKENYTDIVINDKNVVIMSSRNEVVGLTPNKYKAYSSGSSITTADVVKYNLINYRDGKFVRIKSFSED